MAWLRGQVKDLLHEKLPEHGEIGGGHGRVDNVNSAPRTNGGNAEGYTLSRLKRDAPELAERVLRVRAELEAVRAWEVIPPDRPYGGPDELLLAELGVTRAEMDRRVVSVRERAKEIDKDDLPVRAVGKGKAGPGRGNKTDAVRIRFTGSESADY